MKKNIYSIYTMIISGIRKKTAARSIVFPMGRIYMLVIALAAFPFFSAAQDNKLPLKLDEILESYACAENQQEQLFVFLNSGFYYPGEIISFQAVLFGKDMHIKKDGSNFFHLQIINRAGNSIGNYIFELKSGVCSGQVRLADTLYSGLYYIKAYTRWMRNFGMDNCFKRPVLVISPLDGTELSVEAWNDDPVQFFPETGQFIQGIENKMLIRVNSYQPNPVRRILIRDDQDRPVGTCDIDTNGVGILKMTPESGMKYIAVNADTGNSGLLGYLPGSKKEGIGLEMNVSDGQLVIRVSSTLSVSRDQLNVALLSGRKESVVRKITLKDNKGMLSIPCSQVPPGLSQVLLMDNDLVLCSRLWYHSGSASRSSFDAVLRDTLDKRETVTIPDDLSSSADNKQLLALSVNEFNPVTDLHLFDEFGFLKHFCLYSSVPRAELLPVFHENTTDDYINDCLLAYTGTRSWEFLSENNGSYKFQAEMNGITMTGKVISASTQQPVPDAKVLLSYPDSVAYIDYSITNSGGEFSFVLNSMYYGKKVFLVVVDYPHADNTIRILLDEQYESPASKARIGVSHPSFDRILSGHRNIAMAYRVFYGSGNKNDSIVTTAQSNAERHFYGKPDFTLVPADYEALPDLFELKKNLIPGLKLDVEDDYCKMTIFDPYLQLFYPDEALVLLNNVPYPSLKNVLELNSDLIRRIDIKRNKYFFDNLLMYGIVAIYTKKPMQFDPYYSHLQTKAPVVSGKIIERAVLLRNDNKPDVRHSLLWSTGNNTSADQAMIQFRTSDIQGRYQIKAYYVSEKGELSCDSKSFTVF